MEKDSKGIYRPTDIWEGESLSSRASFEEPDEVAGIYDNAEEWEYPWEESKSVVFTKEKIEATHNISNLTDVPLSFFNEEEEEGGFKRRGRLGRRK